MVRQETYKYKELDDEIEEELKQEIDQRKKVAIQENIEMAKVKVNACQVFPSNMYI